MINFLNHIPDNLKPSVNDGNVSQYWYILPVLLVLLSGAFFGYDTTLAEKDLVRMMAALVYGETTGLEVLAGQHYGLSFSFGYYKLLYALAPPDLLLDPDQVARLLNSVGLVFGVLFAFSCSKMLEKLFGSVMAAALAIAFLGSPMMLPFIISGHPLVAATSLLFLSAWLMLLAQEYSRWTNTLAILIVALLTLVIGLTFRAEIALAFPFIAVAMYFHAKEISRNKVVWFLLAVAILTISFLSFLILQRPYVDNSGGAIGSLVGFLDSFFHLGRLGRGIGVYALGLGLFTLLALLATIILRRLRDPFLMPHFMMGLVIALPSLVFWLPNPQPARHFLFAIFGTYLILASFLRSTFNSVTFAILLGAICVVGNQIFAELAYPVLVKSYHWSYDTVSGSRRTTQQLPLGFFPQYQRANQLEQAILRDEAIAFAKTNPNHLIYLADNQFYLIPHLIAKDHHLRIYDTQIGEFNKECNLLKNTDRNIYLLSKYNYWPKDVLFEIINMPEFNDWKIKEQLSSKSRFDKTTLPSDRAF